MTSKIYRIGTRGSRLAIWQADFVSACLAERGFESERVVFSTRGDRELSTPLPELGDKALFTAELDAGLLAGEIDLAVHSLKDLPTELPEGLELTAVPVRAAPWDVLVAGDPEVQQMADLPERAVVATSSLRRAAQLRRWRSDLEIVPVRGNVETRLQKLEEHGWGGIVLAEAGLERLGLADRVSVRISPDIMLPGVSQGALGVVCAIGATAEALRQVLDDPEVHGRVLAERAFLRRLEGGCQVPIGALCTSTEEGLRLQGVVAALDGSKAVHGEASGRVDHPERLGKRLAEDLLARGAHDILSAIRKDA